MDDFEDVKDLRFVPAEREFRVKEDLKEEGLKLDVSTKARIEATIEVLCKFLSSSWWASKCGVFLFTSSHLLFPQKDRTRRIHLHPGRYPGR